MKTGEGKTLTSTLPAYLNALTGEGVHIVTVNDYLAKRDAEWMGVIHRFLGLNVGVILATMQPHERRPAYDADITHGTNNEFGFDYLRDNMAVFTEDLVQRGHAYAIVDEVDSILVDEARTPLIISGATEQGHQWYQQFARLAPRLQRDVHYEVDEGKHTVAINEAGIAKVEEILNIENLYDAINTPLVHHLQNAIRAKELYKRDDEYIVRDGEVLIVDEFTGRVLEGRRYSEGLHQAIEAKESVPIKEENQTYATITLQNYFRMYDKISGMTGTAKTEAAEFNHIYKLGVVEVPTNKPMIRQDHGDVIYKTERAKFEALVDEIAERHERGQPMLVGTVSIEKSERVNRLLEKRGIKAEILNTERHESRRIDNQLRGRSGRQGDPGESRFYLSLEDDLMRMFATKTVGNLMERLSLPDDVPITHKLVTRAIANAQRQVESQNFERRKNVLKYDVVMNEQRDQTLGFLGDVVSSLVAEYCPQGVYPEEWDFEGLFKAIGQLYPTQIEPDTLDLDGLDHNEFENLLLDDAERAYKEREAEFGADLLHALERRVLLTVLDRHWREHLYEMDYLQEGIGLRAIGQRDPLVEYQREGFDMFVAMQDSIKREAVAYVFNASIQVVEEQDERRQAPAPQPTQLSSAATEAEERTTPNPAHPTARRQKGRPQPTLPLRLRQEIQALPRRRHPPRLASPPFFEATPLPAAIRSPEEAGTPSGTS